MRVILRHMIVWTLASFFLVSFTGFRLLVHHCMSCDTTDVALAHLPQGSDCCHGFHEKAGHGHCEMELPKESSCCSVPVDQPDTQDGIYLLPFLGCETDIHYLKNEYKVTTEHTQERIAPVELTVNGIQPSDTMQLPIGDSLLNLYVSNHPPPNPVGKDFVVFACQLKIC
jgi:hypothetical protein